MSEAMLRAAISDPTKAGDLITVDLKPSLWQYFAWLLIHVVVFAFIHLSSLPWALHFALTALVIVSMISIVLARLRMTGPFAYQSLICDATHQWHLQRWHRAHPQLINIMAYRATPFGLSVTCVPWSRSERMLDKLLGQRLQLFVTRDQVSEADYRWLKVLFLHAVQFRDAKPKVTGWLKL